MYAIEHRHIIHIKLCVSIRTDERAYTYTKSRCVKNIYLCIVLVRKWKQAYEQDIDSFLCVCSRFA